MEQTPTCLVKNPAGRTYPVKNLGWLIRRLRNAIPVKIEVLPSLSDRPEGRQWLHVRFDDGYKFACVFEDWAVLLVFLQRRSMSNTPVAWHGHEYCNPDALFEDRGNIFES